MPIPPPHAGTLRTRHALRSLDAAPEFTGQHHWAYLAACRAFRDWRHQCWARLAHTMPYIPPNSAKIRSRQNLMLTLSDNSIFSTKFVYSRRITIIKQHQRKLLKYCRA